MRIRGENADRLGMARAEFAAILFAVPVLCWPAFLNGFPLVFADTGTYLGQARLFYLGWDRPPFYSLFLRATDLGLSLWLPILAQAAIVAHLLFLTLRSLGRRGPWPLLLACLALAAASTLPWVTAELIADVFTGLVVLALWLLGFGRLGQWERLWLLLLAAGAIAVHVSHVPLALGLMLVGAALAAWGGGLRGAWTTAGRMMAPTLLAAAAMVLVNAAGHGIPSLSPFGSVFYAARLIGDGPGRDYLRAACPAAGYAICPHLEELGSGGDEFLWERMPELPALRGAKAWAPEARAIVRGTLAHDPLGVIGAALRNAARQFVFVRLGRELNPWPGLPGPAPLIERYFPHELTAYRRSLQSEGRLRVLAEAISPALNLMAMLGVAGLVVAALLRHRDLAALSLCVLALAAGLGNALVTGGLSGVESRYQARIAWLFLFVPAAALAARPAAPGAAAARAGSTRAPPLSGARPQGVP